MENSLQRHIDFYDDFIENREEFVKIAKKYWITIKRFAKTLKKIDDIKTINFFKRIRINNINVDNQIINRFSKTLLYFYRKIDKRSINKKNNKKIPKKESDEKNSIKNDKIQIYFEYQNKYHFVKNCKKKINKTISIKRIKKKLLSNYTNNV